jgi:hypothetical protein
MDVLTNTTSTMWHGKVEPFIMSNIDAFIALENRTEPLSVSLQTAFEATKTCIAAWFRIFLPFIVILVRSIAVGLAYFVHYVRRAAIIFYPHARRAAHSTYHTFINLHPATRVQIIICVCVLALLWLLQHHIRSRRYLPRLLAAVNDKRTRAATAFNSLQARVAQHSRMAASILPHLAYFSAVIVARWTILSSWQLSDTTAVILGVSYPLLRSIYLSLVAYTFPSKRWQARFIEHTLPDACLSRDAPAGLLPSTLASRRASARVLASSLPWWRLHLRASRTALAALAAIALGLYAHALPLLGHLLALVPPYATLAILAWAAFILPAAVLDAAPAIIRGLPSAPAITGAALPLPEAWRLRLGPWLGILSAGAGVRAVALTAAALAILTPAPFPAWAAAAAALLAPAALALPLLSQHNNNHPSHPVPAPASPPPAPAELVVAAQNVARAAMLLCAGLAAHLALVAARRTALDALPLARLVLAMAVWLHRPWAGDADARAAVRLLGGAAAAGLATAHQAECEAEAGEGKGRVGAGARAGPLVLLATPLLGMRRTARMPGSGKGAVGTQSEDEEEEEDESDTETESDAESESEGDTDVDGCVRRRRTAGEAPREGGELVDDMD